ncbi:MULTISPECIES: sugar ABC transporter permease [unclassified Nocardioides]|uniref:carbohydrate ABC transporter permease n=1 Tax=unclassified Nocardioides TaxID=2615069 RepID=UPI000056F445|nr:MULTISPECIES: sugar ABC transporter permease [unclassified Nocardioides]ABL80933.1 carbohydrate ABC transporter membrane protein 1, CUT1 family [Nocardioides sp. JS614]
MAITGEAAPRTRVSVRTRTRAHLRSESLLGVLFVLPTLVLVGVVVFYPILETALMSVSSVNSLAQREGFTGLENYRTLTDPVFQRVLMQTVGWTVAVVGVTTLVALPVALGLNQKFPGRRIARALLIVPWAASLMINAIIWRWILDGQYSIINGTLMRLQLIDAPIIWLGSERTAWFAIIAVGILVSIPFTAFSLLAGLQSVPEEVYEAAVVDGAGFWSTLLHVTLPLMRPVLVVTTLLNVIYVFNSFPIPWVLTQGAPAYHTDILVTYLYKRAFTEGQFGPAAAMAMVTFVLLLVFSLGFSYLTRERTRAGGR